MVIIVRYEGFLRGAAGVEGERVEVAGGGTVLEALLEVAARRPAAGDLLFLRDGGQAPYVHVLVNGRRVLAKDAGTVLSDGDVLTLVPTLSGG